MGLIGDMFKGARIKDPVEGTAQVVGSTQPPDGATSANVDLTLVVQGEGVAATSVEHSCFAPIKKWPYPGVTLPVTFSRSDPTRLKVRWDDVPEAGDVSKQQADALAQQLNQGGGIPGVTGPGAADVSGIVDALKEAMPGGQIDVGGTAMPGGAQPVEGDDDRVAQIERLAKLKDSGALSESEFEAEKARILGA